MSETKKHILYQLLKVLLFLVLFVVLFYVGLMIGYGVIGDGNPLDALNGEIWVHMKDFLKK